MRKIDAELMEKLLFNLELLDVKSTEAIVENARALLKDKPEVRERIVGDVSEWVMAAVLRSVTGYSGIKKAVWNKEKQITELFLESSHEILALREAAETCPIAFDYAAKLAADYLEVDGMLPPPVLLDFTIGILRGQVYKKTKRGRQSDPKAIYMNRVICMALVGLRCAGLYPTSSEATSAESGHKLIADITHRGENTIRAIWKDREKILNHAVAWGVRLEGVLYIEKYQKAKADFERIRKIRLERAGVMPK